jgi:hypothetical protein
MIATTQRRRDSLYEISGQLGAILAMLDAEGDSGELPDGIDAELDRLEIAFVNKVHGCCAVLRNHETRALAIQSEIDRLSALRDTAERKAIWLRRYIKDAMDRTGQSLVMTPLFTVRVQANSRPQIRLRDGADIPEPFRRIVPARIEFDKEAAYQAWKDGSAIGPDVEIVEGAHLRIL